MADNTTLNTMTGGDVVASDDISGVKYQRIKLIHGADGVNDGDVSTANPLPSELPPVSATGDITAGGQTVSLALEGRTGVAVQVAGTFSAILVIQGTVDGTNWVNLQFRSNSTTSLSTALTSAGIYYPDVTGCTSVRVGVTSYTSGTANIAIKGVASSSAITVAASQVGTFTEANSNSIKTAVEVLDNAISGSEMQVDVVAALPAGTNAIGKLAPNSGVDIGDVDVTSIPVAFNSGASSATTQRTISATDSPDVTALQIIDDWDESDRAKVNPIVGQAGVAAGAGSDSASTLRVTPSTGATSTLSNVAGSASSVTLLSAATTRRKFIMYNDSTQDCYVKYGTTASTSSFTWLVPAGATLEEEHYNGRVDGIWNSANGNMRITEIT